MPEIGLELMRLHSREEFQSWLARELEVRDELYQMIGANLGVDERSLDELEAFLVHRYRDAGAALCLDQRAVLDAASRHIGLVVLLHVDSTAWTIDLEDRRVAHYRLPIICFGDGTVACPLTLATAALERRTRRSLRAALDGYVTAYNTDQ